VREHDIITAVNSSTTRLRLLGAPVITDADGTRVTGAAAEPHRIALLALLALHPKRTVSRAELTSYLWPGHEQKEATQLLNQALFAINKALGDDAIFSSAKEMRLGSRVTVDALDFQAAVDEGRTDDALDLYAGPLLDGFALEDALEFQGWAANERDRLAAARKSLGARSRTAKEILPEIEEPTHEAVREAPTSRAEARRKRSKRSKTPPKVEHVVEEPPPEAPPAPPESPKVIPIEEPPAEQPPDAEEPPPQEASPAEEPTTEPLRAEPQFEVVHAEQEPPPVVEPTADFVLAEPTLTSNPDREPTAPPRHIAPPAEDLSLVYAPPERAEPPARVPPEVTAPPAVEFPAEFGDPPPHIEPHAPAPELLAARETTTPAGDFARHDEPVEFIEPSAVAPDPSPSAAEPARASTVRRRRPMPLPSARLVVTVLVLTLIGVGAFVARGRIVDAGARARDIAGDAGARARDIAGDASARARSIASGIVDARDRPRAIAVLPIEVSGRDPAGPALAAGMTEHLRRMLSNAGLLVTSGDMFAYRTPPYDARSIAETLGVAHVLRGAMQKNDTARFRFQLVAADGTTRWEQDYAPKPADLMVLHDDVVETVARQILERPPARSRRRETQNAAAYQLVLRGNNRALDASDGAARQALDLYQQAIALDSSYARAWAGLAHMYVRSLATIPAAGRDRQLSLAEQAAQRAVAIDDSLAESHAALGVVRSARFDMAGAETELQRALALYPSRATRESLVDVYLFTNRNDEALALVEQALERDPRSPYAHADVARVLQFMNRCDQALARLDSARTTPPLARAAETRALCHAQMGRSNEAIAAARSAVTSRDSSSVSLLAYLLVRAGNTAEATRLRAAVTNRERRGLAGPVDLALLDLGDKNVDAAARRVQEAVDARSFITAPGVQLVTLTAPLFQELHQHQGFLAARRRLGYQ